MKITQPIFLHRLFQKATLVFFVVIYGMLEVPTKVPHVGDAAYSLHENLLVPFIGAHKLNPDKDAFNFHLSQLRIRIEMAFGRLVNKFRILKREIDGLIHNRADIIMACARLHNFIIDMDLE